jgi:hypothetical protein
MSYRYTVEDSINDHIIFKENYDHLLNLPIVKNLMKKNEILKRKNKELRNFVKMISNI